MGQQLPAWVRSPAGPVLGASRLRVPPRQSPTDHPVIALWLAGCGRQVGSSTEGGTPSYPYRGAEGALQADERSSVASGSTSASAVTARMKLVS
jgi:hypothetical protein